MNLRQKTIGRPSPADELWTRFRRLQRTGGIVMGGLPYPRGVQRFASLDAAEQWQTQQRLHRHGRQKTGT